ncbi:hypothetical protein TVAG_390730 [Trichomonas vaginalis G3]|uniref:Vesicle transport protein n=1 Tax=Trichomonas vaginalis (strain ATCC PRA-98 / G3) TaxID=412133 RepID=A2FDY7_TRIV3|nr:Got1/Sft2-like family [Trichomonas vaginalis G3]EAX96866.1 hypothetical protein TVAG_390730 [Trichomonas vaginalis G3]KAI5534784.1 Got1/Sft2-like family [Trichomonas vaginalis G3]|eukprot:XP_001309796.1 hypothetical protein [Trichomonas vaginalis G3]
MSGLIDEIKGGDDDCELCKCSLKVRLIGGIACAVISAIFCFLSFIPFWQDNMVGFAILYALGSIGAIASTFFFSGWKKQWKNIKSSVPCLIAAIVVIVCILLLLIVGIITKSKALCVICVICQWVAQVFYIICSFPGGWTAIKTTCGALCH